MKSQLGQSFTSTISSLSSVGVDRFRLLLKGWGVKVLSLLVVVMVGGSVVKAQSFTSTSATGSWSSSRWNNSTDAAPYLSAFTANNSASFTSGTYNFSGGGTIQVGNVNVASGVTVNFTSISGTFGTNGAVRTYNIGSGGLFDFNGQAISTASGTGFIKSGDGVFATGGGNFTGGFTINAGTVIARSTTGLGSGTGNILSLSGGTIASNTSRDFSNTRFPGGIVIGGNVQFGEMSTVVSLANSTADLSFANNVSLGSSLRTLTLGNGGITTFSGVISGSGGLIFAANTNVTGKFVLSGANTYTGNTTIYSGKLALSGSGSISTSPIITVGSGATFDISGSSDLTLAVGQSFRTSATGSSTTATLTVVSKSLTLSSGGIAFTDYNGGATAPMTIVGTNGSLALASRPVTVTTSIALTAGTYKLIAKSGAEVTGTPGTLTMAGSGLAANTSGALSVVSGELILTVTNTGPSTDANLSALTTTATGFTPTFAASTTAYDATVPYATATTTVTATRNQAAATLEVQVNGGSFTSLANATATGALSLNVGANTINIKVTAEDLNTQKTYTLTVERAAAATNANLSALTTTASSFSPTFVSGTTSYTASVLNGVTSTTVTPTKANAGATILVRVNGGAYTAVASGSASSALSLNVGANPIEVLVTAEDGSTTQTYTITVTRASATSPILNSITLINPLSTTYGTASSGVSFTASGSNLTENITATAQTGYLVSSDNTTYTSSVSVANGSTVYVAFSSTCAAASYNGATAVVLSSNGATNSNVTTSATDNTVSQKVLTIVGLTAQNKTYDGLTTATVTGTAALISGGVVNSDVVSLSGTPSFNFSSAVVGTGINISTTNYTITGAGSGNYTLTQPSFSADVTVKSLTITANNVSKVAGVVLTGGAGSTAFSSIGLQNSESIGTVTITYGTAGEATGDGNTVGTYASQVTPSVAIGGTFTAANYSIIFISGSITVTPAPETIAIQDFETSTATPTWSYSATGGEANSTASRFNGALSYRIGSSDQLIMDNLDISNYTSVSLSVAFAASGVDSGEDLFMDISYDNGTTWTGTGSIKLVDGYSNALININTTNSFDPTTVGSNPWPTSIVSSETQIRVRFRVVGLEAYEYYWIDDIKVTGTVIPSAPILTTPTSTSIATTSATLGATVTSSFGASITARGTVWGTAASPTGNSSAASGTTVGAFTHSRTGLTANTLYYYRGYATNSVGTGYSADANFTTLSLAPTIGTGSNATTSSFTANWSAPAIQGSALFTYQIDVDDDINFGSINFTQNAISSVTTSTNVNSGLTANTAYYYRVRAVNDGGNSAYSSTSAAYSTSAFSIVTLSNANLAQFTTQNITRGTTELPIYRIQVDVTNADAVLNTLTFTTPASITNSNYVSSDITNFKAFLTTSTTFNNSNPLGIVSPSGKVQSNLGETGISFTSLNTTLSYTTQTYYIWLTADVLGGAVAGRNIIVNAPTIDITGSVSGTTSATGIQTIIAGAATNYYLVGTNLADETNWNTDANALPSALTGRLYTVINPNDVNLNIDNESVSNSSSLSLGSNAKLIIKNTGQLTLTAGTINGTIDVENGGTLNINTTSIPTLGTLGTTSSTVIYSANGNQSVTTKPYAHLTLSGSGIKTIGAATVSGTLSLNDGILDIGSNTFVINGPTSRTNGTIDAEDGTISFGNVAELTLPTSLFSGSINTLAKSSGSGVLILNDNLNVTNLSTASSTGAIVLASNKQLTVGGIIDNNGTLTIENGATLKQTRTGADANTGSGTYNVKQNITGSGTTTPNGRFWYLGSPLSNGSSTALLSNSNQLWQWNEGTFGYSLVTNGNLTQGKSYVLRSGQNETINFSGSILSNGTVTVPNLTRTGTSQQFRGCHLVSNPYPSYLDWDLVEKTNISTTMYVRTALGTNYNVLETYNSYDHIGTSISGPEMTKFIAPMQGFWVKVTADNLTGSLTMNNSMRDHLTGGSGLRSSAIDFPAFLRFNILDGQNKDQVILFMSPDATAGIDGHDSEKMSASGYAQFYSTVNAKKLVINGMKNVKAKTSVPLTLEIPTSKSYIFQAEEFNIEDGLILLEDKQEGIIQDLTINPTYSFFGNAGTNTTRFVIHFQLAGAPVLVDGPMELESLGSDELTTDNIQIVSNNLGTIIVRLDEGFKPEGTIRIFDASGRLVEQSDFNDLETTIHLNEQAGMYFVEVAAGKLMVKKKIVIE